MKYYSCLLDYIKSHPKDMLFREVWHSHSNKDIGKGIQYTDYPDRAARYLGFTQGIPPQSRYGNDYMLKWLPVPDDDTILENYAKIFSHYNCYTTLNYYSYEYAIEKAKVLNMVEKLHRFRALPNIFSSEQIRAQEQRVLTNSVHIPNACFMDLAFDFDVGPGKVINTLDEAIPQVNKLIEYLKRYNSPYSLFFSGGRGFHLVVPHTSFGQKMADNNHLVNRHMAELIDFEIGPLHIDYAIYSSRRQFRMVDTIHQTSGFKKKRISEHDLNKGEKHILHLAR